MSRLLHIEPRNSIVRPLPLLPPPPPPPPAPPPPPSLFKGEGVNFDYLQQGGGESEKSKKGDGSMQQRQVFLKWGGEGTRTFLFNFF